MTGEFVDVRLAFVAPYESARPSHNPGLRYVVLAIDVSQSMGTGPGSPRSRAFKVIKEIIDNCQESMRVGIVAFHHDAFIVSDFSEPGFALKERLLKVRGSGQTRIDCGLNRAAEMVRQHRDPADVGTPIVILLSDGSTEYKESAISASSELKGDGIEIAVVSLGYGVEERFLREIATTDKSGQNWYYTVDQPDGMTRLFCPLSTSLHNVSVTDVQVTENYHSRDALTLDAVSGHQPSGINLGTSQIHWQSPHVSSTGLLLDYRLKARQAGWYCVAENSATVSYRLVDKQDTQSEEFSNRTPWLLVLPRWPVWPFWWFLLNPLYWMLLNPALKRLAHLVRIGENVEPNQKETLAFAAPPPEAVLPPPIAIPAATPFRPACRSALVIGVGYTGLWTLTQFKAGLISRLDEVPDTIQIRHFDFGRSETVSFAGQLLHGVERTSIGMDLYPVLNGERPEEKYPWLEEAGLRERGTGNDLSRGSQGDRRAAKLALIKHRDSVVEVLRSAIADTGLKNVPEVDILIVGSAEGGCSGIIPDMAYLIRQVLRSENREAVDVSLFLIIKGMRGAHADNWTALARELSRINGLREVRLTSDVGDSTSDGETRWVDRVFLLGPSAGPASSLVGVADVPPLTGEAAQTMSLWLSSPRFRQFWRDFPEPPNNRGGFYRLGVQALRLPIREIDQYLVTRATADLIVSRLLRARRSGTRLATNIDEDALVTVVQALLTNAQFSQGRPEILAMLPELRDQQRCEYELVYSKIATASRMSEFELAAAHDIVAKQVPNLLRSWAIWILNGNLRLGDLIDAEKVMNARHGRLPLLHAALRRLYEMLDLANHLVGNLKGRSKQREPTVNQVLSHLSICRVHIKRLLEQVELWHLVLLDGKAKPGNILGDSFEIRGLSRRLLVREQTARTILDGLVQSAENDAGKHKPRFLVDKGRIEQIYNDRYVQTRDLLLGRFVWRVDFSEVRGTWSINLKIRSDNLYDFTPDTKSLDRLAEVVDQLVGAQVRETWRESLAGRVIENDIPETCMETRLSALPTHVKCHLFRYDTNPGVFTTEYLRRFAPHRPESISPNQDDPHLSALVIANANLNFEPDLAKPEPGKVYPHVLAPESMANRLEHLLRARGAVIRPISPAVTNLLVHTDRFATFLQAALNGQVRQILASGTPQWIFSNGSDRVLITSGESPEQAADHWILRGSDSVGRLPRCPNFASFAAVINGEAVSSWPELFTKRLNDNLLGADTTWLQSMGVASAGLLLDASRVLRNDSH